MILIFFCIKIEYTRDKIITRERKEWGTHGENRFFEYMSIEKVKHYFKGYGIEGRIKEFEASSATVELAAAALGCEGARIAKSISLKAGDGAIIIVCAGDVKINNQKYKTHFGTKAKMLGFTEVEELIGHAVGGVCPFAVNDGVKVYLDISLRRFDIVYPACGSANSAIGLTIPELEKYSGCIGWVDVCTE